MTKWLLCSDIFPITVFIYCFCLEPSLLIAGMIICRTFSLLFHLFSEAHPYLINLDYIGIACMSLAAPAVCTVSGCPFCKEYELILAMAFASACIVFAHSLLHKKIPHNAQPIIIGLAVLAHSLSAWVVITKQDAKLLASMGAFGVGYFVVEPHSHVSWHWIAAAGQGLLVWYVWR